MSRLQKGQNREMLQTVVKYYLGEYDTEVSAFNAKIGKKKNRYSFDVRPNPNSNISVLTDDDVVTMSLIFDKIMRCIYVQIGNYKETISDYDYKNIKQSFFTRMHYIDNTLNANKKVYNFIEETYQFIREPHGNKVAAENGMDMEMDMPTMDRNYDDPVEAMEEVAYNEVEMTEERGDRI